MSYRSLAEHNADVIAREDHLQPPDEAYDDSDESAQQQVDRAIDDMAIRSILRDIWQHFDLRAEDFEVLCRRCNIDIRDVT